MVIYPDQTFSPAVLPKSILNFYEKSWTKIRWVNDLRPIGKNWEGNEWLESLWLELGCVMSYNVVVVNGQGTNFHGRFRRSRS